jgi:hypothetical protein
MYLAYYAPLPQKGIPFETCQGWQSPQLPFLDEVALLPEVHSADRAAPHGKANQRQRRLPYRRLPLSSAYDNNINQ